MEAGLKKHINSQIMTNVLILLLVMLIILFIFIRKNNTNVLNSIKSNLTYSLSTKLSVNHLDHILTYVIENTSIYANIATDSFKPEYINNKQSLKNYLNSIDNITKQTILITKGAQGVWLQIDPNITSKDTSFYSWYYYKNEKLLKYPRIGGTLKESEHAYYYKAKRAKRAVWTDVYSDPDLNIPMITYNIPLYKNQKFIGVAGIDISLKCINNILKHINSEYSGSELYLIDKDFKIISSYPYSQSLFNKNLFNTRKNLKFLKEKITQNKFHESIDFRDGSIYKTAVISDLSNQNHLIVTIPTSTIYENFSELIFLTYIIFGILVVFTFYALTSKYKLKNTNYKLEQQTSLQRLLIDSTPDIIFLKNLDGQYLECNSAFIEFAGKSREEILGKTVYDIFSKKFADLHSQKDQMVVDSGVLLHYECWFDYSEGKRTRVDLFRVPFYNSKHELIGILSIARDITERKKAEIEIIKAKELAEKASKQRADFLANMSHEIRTPMNGVLGYIQLLSETELNVEQTDFVNEAIKSSESLIYIINDILDFSKIEAGKLILKNISFDLRSLVEDVATSATALAYQKGLDVNALIYADIPQRVYGDPGRLRQVLNNLVNNAVKFTDKGEILIIVRKVFEKDNSVKILFEVEDTGIGIPEDSKQSIFEAFIQADTSATRKFGGTGLGLSISKHIIEMMNGNITLESEVGVGSKFSFTAQFTNDHSCNDTSNKTVNSIKDKAILVVDDNSTNLKIARYYLEEAGCIVHEANCVNKALEVLKNHNNVEVMLVDCNMPEKDGFELAEIVKSDPKYKHILLIMLTSLASRGDGKIAAEKGFIGYLTKPVKKSDLLESVALALDSEKNLSQNNENLLVTKHIVKENNFNNKFKILVAEDNEINQKLIVKILNKAGYICDIAGNGLEAVNAYKNNKYDLILMDCQMPEMDGYRATKEIRNIENARKAAQSGLKHIPIIALTAHAMEGDTEKCIDIGMDDYISKPVEIVKLYSLISSYLPVNNLNKANPLISNKSYEIDKDSYIHEIICEIIEDLNFTLEEAMDLIKEFLESSVKSTQDLYTALENSDFDSLKQTAHTLKGLSANLRLEKLRELYLNLEKAALLKDKTLTNIIIKEIENHLTFIKSQF